MGILFTIPGVVLSWYEYDHILVYTLFLDKICFLIHKCGCYYYVTCINHTQCDGIWRYSSNEICNKYGQ